MAKSAAFTRIKADVLGIVRDVPCGRVCTRGAIGRHLDVMARHVDRSSFASRLGGAKLVRAGAGAGRDAARSRR